MKKLKLSELNLGKAEVLTREELKKVLGGLGSGGSGGSVDVACCKHDNPDDCGICMPDSMMPPCPSGYDRAACIYG